VTARVYILESYTILIKRLITMNDKWVKLREKEDKEWKAKHGDIVMFLDGKGYTAKQLADRKKRAVIKADLILKRLGMLK